MRNLLVAAAAALMALASTAEAGSIGMYFVQPKVTTFTQSMLGFQDAAAFVRWMGCRDTTVYHVLTDRINAGFATDGDHKGIYLFQGILNVFPDELSQATILAHEAGHCLQYQRGEFSAADRYTIDEIRTLEYGAEAFAHRILTVLGYPATDILAAMRHRFAQLRHITDDYGEDEAHGSAHSIVAWARLHNGYPTRLVLAP